jgi:hypothetical protein
MGKLYFASWIRSEKVVLLTGLKRNYQESDERKYNLLIARQLVITFCHACIDFLDDISKRTFVIRRSCYTNAGWNVFRYSATSMPLHTSLAIHNRKGVVCG